MRIIFQDGGVAELTNVDKIRIYNPGEVKILKEAIGSYFLKELRDQLGIKEDKGEQSSSETVCDGTISERYMASEGSQHAGQAGLCDLPSEGGESKTP